MNFRNLVPIILLLFVMFLLLSCQKSSEEKEDVVDCLPPMISIAGECCMDKNSNSICDEFEVEEKEEEIKEKEETKEIKLEKEYMNLTQLEEELNKVFSTKYPKFNFTFGDMEREGNLTDIENTFDVRRSIYDMIYILKIKKAYNFINSYDNFTDFVRRKYELTIKNDNIWANSYIDYKIMQTIDWEDMFYDYDYNLEEIDLSGTKLFFERHAILFIKPVNNARDVYIELKAVIWCTPELIIEVNPTGLPQTSWTGDADDVKATIRMEDEKIKKDILKRSEKVVKICSTTS